MKRMRKVWLIGILVVVLVVAISSLVAAQNQNCINEPFSLEKDHGYYISPGSVVHYSDSITTLYGPGGNVTLRIKDSRVPKLSTPAGYSLPVTHLFQVPSESYIHKDGNETKIYKNGECILTVINDVAVIPAYDGWIEQANDWSVANLDWFEAYWEVPTSPPNPDSSVVDFLFNAIEPSDGSSIIQPVLEWNWGDSGRWTAAAWYVENGVGYRSDPINVNVGDTLNGGMWYLPSGINMWDVYIEDQNTDRGTAIYTDVIGTSNLATFVALEGYNIDGDSDVPGDTTFYNMDFSYQSNPVDITWNSDIDDTAPLTGLDVTIYSDSRVELETAN